MFWIALDVNQLKINLIHSGSIRMNLNQVFKTNESELGLILTEFLIQILVQIHADCNFQLNRNESDWLLTYRHWTRFKQFFEFVRNNVEWFRFVQIEFLSVTFAGNLKRYPLGLFWTHVLLCMFYTISYTNLRVLRTWHLKNIIIVLFSKRLMKFIVSEYLLL